MLAKSHIRLVGVTFVLIAFAGGGVEAQFIENGSFESGTPDPGGGFVLHSAGSTAIDDWMVTFGNVHHVGTYWEADNGRNSVDLNGSITGGLAQTFTTDPGSTYDILFALSGNPDGGPTEKLLLVEADGQSNNYNFDITGQNRSSMGWRQEIFTFVADDDEAILSFSSQVAGHFGPVIDSVMISGEHSVSPN
jgi:choice-of-anchor C domain-containing protein